MEQVNLLAFSASNPTLPVGRSGAPPFGYGWAMPPVPRYNQGTIVSLPLYDGGRVNAEVRSAMATRRAAESEVPSTEQEIALRTKEAYDAVLKGRVLEEKASCTDVGMTATTRPARLDRA